MNSSPQNTDIQKQSFLKQNVPQGVIHCFSGIPKHAKLFIEMGFLFGIDGPVTYKESDNLKQIVFETDLNELLVETDCQYLAPQVN
jgi:TatD DNase family protein